LIYKEIYLSQTSGHSSFKNIATVAATAISGQFKAKYGGKGMGERSLVHKKGKFPCTNLAILA